MEQHIIESLNQMQTLIYNDDAKNLANRMNNKDIVIFLGNTRSGKSTVVNYIIGTPLIANKVRNNIFNIAKENPASAGPAIGAGSASETTVPSTWTSPKFSSLIVDAPGFYDNRGEAQDVANSFYVKEILSNINSGKFVIICDINDILNDNISPFISLIDNVHNMLPIADRMNPSVIMIFTKDRENITKDDIVIVLKEKIVHQPAIQIANRPLINHLVNNPNQIAIVNMPKREGKVNEAEVFGDLISVIENNATKLNKDILASVAPGLSDKSRNFLLEARKYFSEIKEFDQVMSNVLNQCNVILAEYENVNSFTNSGQIPPMKERLNGVENNVKSIQNPSWNTKELLHRMSAVFPAVNDLKDGAGIYVKMEFIAFVDSILKLTESNVFKVKANETINQMLNRINQCRSKLNDRQTLLQDEENRIRLQKLKEEQERQAELLRLELEKQKQIQESIIRDPPRPNPVDRVVENVIIRPVNVVYKPIERVVKKCSIM